MVVLITDHREAIDDFSSLVVTATGARLHRRGHVPEEGWSVIEAPAREVDLTRYRDGATFELVRAPVAAGRYDAADLILAGPARGVVLAGDTGSGAAGALAGAGGGRGAAGPGDAPDLRSGGARPARPSRQDLGRTPGRGARRRRGGHRTRVTAAVAQECLDFSRHMVLNAATGALEGRYVDLRVFALQDGSGRVDRVSRRSDPGRSRHRTHHQPSGGWVRSSLPGCPGRSLHGCAGLLTP